jgi:hypothetical protein
MCREEADKRGKSGPTTIQGKAALQQKAKESNDIGNSQGQIQRPNKETRTRTSTRTSSSTIQERSSEW